MGGFGRCNKKGPGWGLVLRQFRCVDTVVVSSLWGHSGLLVVHGRLVNNKSGVPGGCQGTRLTASDSSLTVGQMTKKLVAVRCLPPA